MSADPDVRLTAWVHGRVQGVGFRWWTRSRALELGLTGYAANKPDGRVQVVAQGPRAQCQRLLDLLVGGATPGTVDKVIAVTQGDCSNTHALMETLEFEGIPAIPFMYPYDRDKQFLKLQIGKLSRELGEPSLAVESLAVLAHISLAEGNLAQAQTQVDEVIAFLEDNSLDGADEPFRVYLSCYHVLRRNQDPRAQKTLAEAHRLLRARAAKIGDDELRRSFLEDVTAHREVVEAFECLSTGEQDLRL